MAKSKYTGTENNSDSGIIIKSMDDVMHDSMLPYAEHVILERALPRVEDGLKPVQRRILYTMMELGLSPDKQHRKSARIVGDCLGKYHPHGDSSVYDAMVRMAQPFNMRVPLVDGHGNFGSMDGDTAAAMRYTEARMTPAAMQLLRDIDKDTVKFSLNFDDTLKEPDILPGRFPNLLINGSNGIAVGLTTSIPPHNPTEAMDAVIARINDPEISLDEIMKIMPCPDFPTGGYLINNDEIRSAYETGRGKLTNRAKVHLEELKNGKTNIVITEFPYQVNKASALEKILGLVQQKKAIFSGVSDIRDESDRTGVRAVVEVKKGFDADKILRALFRYSDLQKTVSVIMVAIADGKPKLMNLMQVLDYYIKHQENVVTRRCKNELEQAEKRAHILQGLVIALLNIDEVIKLIRASKSPKIAKEGLMERFELSALQAEAILDLRLQRLTNLEQIEIEKEYADIQKRIAHLKAVLASKKKLDKMIIDELTEIKAVIASPRRTQLIDESLVNTDDDFKPEVVEEPAVVMLLSDNRIRRVQPKFALPDFIASETSESVFNTTDQRCIRMLTNKGSCLMLPVSDIPETKPGAKPTNLSAIIELDDDEKILAAFEGDFESGKLFFYTRNGLVKATDATEYNSKNKRIAAVNIKEDDALISVEYVDNDSAFDSIMLVTERGMSIRFPSEQVPSMGRASAGVKGIKLEENDRVIYAVHLNEEGELLTVTDRGYMKRSFIFNHDQQSRNGKGEQCFGFKKNGSNGTFIAAALYVREPRDLIAVQEQGDETVFNTEEVRIEPRTGKGQLMAAVLMNNIVVNIKNKT